MKIFFGIVILLLLVAMSLFIVFAVILGIYNLIYKKTKKWINRRKDDIISELDKGSFDLSENRSYNFLSFVYYGYSVHDYKNNRKTKILSPWALQRLIFKMYKTDYIKVLNKYFDEYEISELKRIEKSNKELFSNNKYKRAVRFKVQDME